MTWSPPPAASRSPHAREAPDERRPPRLPHATVIALLGVVAVTSALAGPWRGGDPLLVAELEEPVPPPPPPPPPEQESRDDLVDALRGLGTPDFDLNWIWAVAVAALLLALGAVVRQVLRARRDGTPGDPVVGEVGDAVIDATDDVTAAQLQDAVDDAATHLRDERSPTDAVVAAWVSLETAAERTGVHRDPADTPTEFTLAVLDRAHADPAATRTLLDLYLRARFSDEPLDRPAVDAAQAALDRISAGLTDRAAATSDDASGPAAHPASDPDPDPTSDPDSDPTSDDVPAAPSEDRP